MMFIFFKGFWVIYIVRITTGSTSDKMILKFIFQLIQSFHNLE